jgi:phage terminase large subunit
MRSLLAWIKHHKVEKPPVWRPTPLKHDQWPPDYDAVYRWRADTLKGLLNNPAAIQGAFTYYSTRPVEFIMDWLDTYDPRKSPTHEDPRIRGEKWMPFVFFYKQSEVVEFFQDLDRTQESGLVEKCRDAGLTWIAVGYSIWRWIFIKDDAVGWGSRKEILVDKLGDPDSIFEKMRLVLRRMPAIWLPKNFNWSRHATFMKLLNPENGAIIAGEAGDNIGRGGRKSIYFVDEAAHLEHPEKVDSALGDNTNVRIDISSVNGLGNVFHRRRENGVIWQKGIKLARGFVRIFIMDWRDHPNKTQDWYDVRKAKAEREGLQHIFAQEVDRDYSAAVSNVVIPYEWIASAVDAHKKIPYLAAVVDQNLGKWWAGLDVADDGADRNALTLREWIIWRHVEEWGERDPGVSARRAIIACRPYQGRIECQYDCIGVGAGVKAEYNRLTDDEQIISRQKLPFVPWNAGSGVLKPFDRIIPDDDESLINKNFFDNLKAQAWWSLRTRFYKTHKALTEGVVYPVDELISLDSTMALLEQLKKELAQPTRGQSARLKMIIEKKPNGTKSPNLADSGVQAFFPVPSDISEVQVGTYGS